MKSHEKDQQRISDLENGVRTQKRMTEDAMTKLSQLNLQRKKDQENLTSLEATIQQEMQKFSSIIEIFKRERDDLHSRNLELKDLNYKLKQKLTSVTLN